MSGYYSYVRQEIAPLLPKTASRIVDVGCGSGRTSAWIRQLYPDAYLIGLEGNPNVKAELEMNVDEAHIVDLTKELPDIGRPDLVLFLDVLEHLPQPEILLAKVVERLAPGATVITSLPNVAHYSVAIPLLFNASFEYKDAGILDRTHLRFFVKETAVTLLNEAGLVVTKGIMSGFHGKKARLLDRLTFGTMREHLAKQYIMAARQGVRASQPRVNWNPRA